MHVKPDSSPDRVAAGLAIASMRLGPHISHLMLLDIAVAYVIRDSGTEKVMKYFTSRAVAEI